MGSTVVLTGTTTTTVTIAKKDWLWPLGGLRLHRGRLRRGHRFPVLFGVLTLTLIVLQVLFHLVLLHLLPIDGSSSSSSSRRDPISTATSEEEEGVLSLSPHFHFTNIYNNIYNIHSTDYESHHHNNNNNNDGNAEVLLHTNSIYSPERYYNFSTLQSIGFLHMGKTAGSSISVLLRNGCHAYLPKPCDKYNGHESPNDNNDENNNNDNNSTIQEESIVSQLVTDYYHIFRDRRHIGTTQQTTLHDGWIVTTRDVYERFVSAFVYDHPNNTEYLPDLTPWHKTQIAKKSTKVYYCFPTLQRFGDLLEGYQQRTLSRSDKHCGKLAHGMIHGTLAVKRTMHLNQNYQVTLQQVLPVLLQLRERNATHLLNLTSDNNFQSGYTGYTKYDVFPPTPIPLFVIRQEHLWEDWAAINELLHQWGPRRGEGHNQHEMIALPTSQQEQNQPKHNQQQQPHQDHALRNTSTLPITLPINKKDISYRHRLVFCLELQEEYRAYFQLLRLARNLIDPETAAAAAAATKDDPKALLQSTALDDAVQIAKRSCPNLNMTQLFLPVL